MPGNANSPDLDGLLTPEEAARWLGISLRELRRKSAGPRPPIPPFRVTRELVRYHPRTVLAVLASRAAVPQEVIAVSFGGTPSQHNHKGAAA